MCFCPRIESRMPSPTRASISLLSDQPQQGIARVEGTSMDTNPGSGHATMAPKLRKAGLLPR